MSPATATSPATTLIVTDAARWTALDDLLGSTPRSTLRVMLSDSDSLREAIAAAPGDVVIAQRPCRLEPGWFTALDLVLGDDPSLLIATCVAMSVDGSDEQPNQVSSAAAVPATLSRLSAPHTGVVIALFRRAALDLIGSIDSAREWSVESLLNGASSIGLVITLAEHVVARLSSGEAYYPEEPDAASAWRARAASRIRSGTLAVTLDCRALTDSRSGTQVATLETFRALARRDDIDLRALVPPDLSGEGRTIANDFGVELQRADQLRADIRCDDVVHRPHQFYTADDLAVLRPLGRRLVVTQLDLIGYRNAVYARSPAEWRAHRTATSLGLALADRVVVPSTWVRQDLEAERLVAPDRICVVSLGVAESGSASRPDALPTGVDAFLLVLGADYLHKNRLFALRVFAQLAEAHSWEGSIVFAGPWVAHGGTREAELRSVHEGLAFGNRIFDIKVVTAEEKAWLLREAALVLVPSAAEGFGFVPFEAALSGTAAAWSPTTSMREVLPTELATIVAWDEEASACGVAELLADEGARERVVSGVLGAARAYTWDRHAEDLIDTYRSSIDGYIPRDVHLINKAHEALRVAEMSAHGESRARDDREELRQQVHAVFPLVDGSSRLRPATQAMIVALASKSVSRSAMDAAGVSMEAAGVCYTKLRRWRRSVRVPKDS